MTQLTVREALTIDTLRNVRVLAGSAGLDRTITCVNVMEVPDILQWVRGGELLLTTTYPLKDSRLSLRDLILKLYEKDLAAIAIKPHRYLEEIPQEILAIADTLAFPVLELPNDASFVDLIHAVLTRILNAQAELLVRSEEIHRRFTDVVLEGGGLVEIAGLLAALLEKPVSILGVDGDLLADAWAGPGGRAQADNGWLLRNFATARPVHSWQHGMLQRKLVDSPDGEVQVVQRPIKTGRLHYGELIVWEGSTPIRESDLVAVDHASTVAALAISKARAVSEVELRFRNDFLNDLLSGNIHDRAMLLARAEVLGWSLEGAFSIITAELQGLEASYAAGSDENATSSLEPRFTHARRMGRQVAEVARQLDPSVITWTRTDSIVALYPVPQTSSSDEARKRAMRFAAQLQHRLVFDDGLSPSWGISELCTDALYLHRAYGQARLAAAIGRLIGEPGSLHHYADMGVYRLLHRFPDQHVLHEFANEVLRPVLDYETRHHTELLSTVEQYLACEQNLALAARELNLHYNTVKYRVLKADTLLSGALHNPHRRLEVELAIKALKMSPR